MKVQRYLNTRHLEATNIHVQTPPNTAESKVPQALQSARQAAGTLTSPIPPKPLVSEKHPKGLRIAEDGVSLKSSVMHNLTNNEDEIAERELRASLGEMVTDAFKWRFDPLSLSEIVRT